MKYKFPVINTINDVLPHLDGRKEFVVANRGDHIIINYAVAFADTFCPVTTLGDAIRRECRGLIFRASDGQIIRRPYHKFFNVGEKEETDPKIIDELLDDAHSLEKLDGSMIAPYAVTFGNLRWGTKMGDTDVARMVIPFLERNGHYIEFARGLIISGYTPIFEFCSRQQRIVVDYEVERLVLTAIRNMETGEYLPYAVMKKMAADKRIESVDLLAFDRDALGVEGVVIRLSDGHMAKMKAESYMRIHKAKDKITVEKNAVDAILNNEIDDLLPELGQEDRDRVVALDIALHRFLENRSAYLNEQVAEDVAMFKDKKTYALEAQRPQFHKAAVFKLWDEPEGAYEYLMAQLTKSLGKEVNYADFKRMWGFDYDYSQ
jgi:RNA ligase